MPRERFLNRVIKKVSNQASASSLIKGLDIVGDIAIIKLPEELASTASEIGEAILEEAPYIKAVLNQTTPVSGEYRIRKLEWLAGEKRTTTIHREYGCQYKVDLKTSYFSPRLAYERIRIAKLVRQEFDAKDKLEVITNLFAGVGCFSILIAKQSPIEKIYSIDINPEAVNMMEENILLNKVVEQVIPILGDASEIIKLKLKGKADRVLMPLPERAIKFLDAALIALKPNGGYIHYQDFVHASTQEDPVQESTEKLIKKMNDFNQDYEIFNARVIRDVGPNWYHVGIDMIITH